MLAVAAAAIVLTEESAAVLLIKCSCLRVFWVPQRTTSARASCALVARFATFASPFAPLASYWLFKVWPLLCDAHPACAYRSYSSSALPSFSPPLGHDQDQAISEIGLGSWAVGSTSIDPWSSPYHSTWGAFLCQPRKATACCLLLLLHRHSYQGCCYGANHQCLDFGQGYCIPSKKLICFSLVNGPWLRLCGERFTASGANCWSTQKCSLSLTSHLLSMMDSQMSCFPRAHWVSWDEGCLSWMEEAMG